MRGRRCIDLMEPPLSRLRERERVLGSSNALKFGVVFTACSQIRFGCSVFENNGGFPDGGSLPFLFL